MNPSTKYPSVPVLTESAKVPFNDASRCLCRFANGKRCRLTGSHPHFGLCPHHFSLTKPTTSLELYNNAEDLSADLLPQLSQPSPPPSSLTPLSRHLLSISANFSAAFSLWSPRAASRLDAPPFSLTSLISSCSLAPALITDKYSTARNVTAGCSPPASPKRDWLDYS